MKIKIGPIEVEDSQDMWVLAILILSFFAFVIIAAPQGCANQAAVSMHNRTMEMCEQAVIRGTTPLPPVCNVEPPK